MLLIIGFFVWMQRRAAGQMGNVMSIGRSKAKAYTQDKPSTTFSDIAGYEGVKTEITEVVDFLRMPERFRRSALACRRASCSSARQDRQDAVRPRSRR